MNCLECIRGTIDHIADERDARSIERNGLKLPRVNAKFTETEAKGKPPFCGCSYCQRGNIKSKRIRERYDKAM